MLKLIVECQPADPMLLTNAYNPYWLPPTTSSSSATTSTSLVLETWQECWLSLAVSILELLICIRFEHGLFPKSIRPWLISRIMDRGGLPSNDVKQLDLDSMLKCLCTPACAAEPCPPHLGVAWWSSD